MSNPMEENNYVKNVLYGNAENIGHFDIGDKTYNTIHQEKPIPKALTYNIPLLSKEKIIGRDAYLVKLHEILNEKKDAVLVNGFGGVGKTTIAQVYCHTYWDEYAHVAWITLNSDDYVFEIVNASGLKESLNISIDETDIHQLFSRIMVEINRISDKPNLLILDNAVEKLSKFKSYLPSTHEWHILVTAREDINGFTAHYLDFLDEDDAVALFKHFYFHKVLNEDQISELVKKVEFHTLTIEILAKTAQLKRLSFETLVDALQKDIKSGIRTSRSGQEKIENITGYLSSIFALNDLSENEMWLLKNMLFLPSGFYTYDILFELIDPEGSNKEDIFAETLNILVQRSMLQFNANSDSYKLHIVIAEVLQKEEPIRFDDVSGLINKLSSLLHLDQNVDNPVDKFKWTPISQYASSKLNGIQDITADGENQFLTFYSNLALVLKDLGDYEGAKTLLNKVLVSDEKNFGPDHPSTAISYSNLALVLRDLGDYDGAKSLLTKAMIIDEKNFSPDHPSTAIRYSNLALVLQDLGDYEGAKTLLSKVLVSDEKNFGPDHPSTAISYSNLALVLRDLGDYEGAKSLLTKAMISDEKNFGPDHPSTSRSYSNLALVVQDFGDYEGAKELLKKAMHSNEKNFGPDHPTSAINYSNLALVLKDLNEIPEAMILSKKALDIFKKTLPENHPNVKTVEEIYNHLKSLS